MKGLESLECWFSESVEYDSFWFEVQRVMKRACETCWRVHVVAACRVVHFIHRLHSSSLLRFP